MSYFWCLRVSPHAYRHLQDITFCFIRSTVVQSALLLHILSTFSNPWLGCCIAQNLSFVTFTFTVLIQSEGADETQISAAIIYLNRKWASQYSKWGSSAILHCLLIQIAKVVPQRLGIVHSCQCHWLLRTFKWIASLLGTSSPSKLLFNFPNKSSISIKATFWFPHYLL